MKIKILSICICMLMISTLFTATGTQNQTTTSAPQKIDSVPVLEIVDIDGGLFRIRALLANSGEGTAENILWDMTVDGGIFYYPTTASGEIDFLGPGEDAVLEVLPMIGIGVATITFHCTYNILNLSCGVDFEVKQEWRLQPFFLIFLNFPESIQPAKLWTEIPPDDVHYFNETDIMGVEFWVEGITNMHNVRVVSDKSTKSDGVEFLAACKFTNGNATLYECGLTYDIVIYGGAHWEIETLDGE